MRNTVDKLDNMPSETGMKIYDGNGDGGRHDWDDDRCELYELCILIAC